MDGHLYERECDVDGADQSLIHIVPEEITVERTIRTHHALADQWASHESWRVAA